MPSSINICCCSSSSFSILHSVSLPCCRCRAVVAVPSLPCRRCHAILFTSRTKCRCCRAIFRTHPQHCTPMTNSLRQVRGSKPANLVPELPLSSAFDQYSESINRLNSVLTIAMPMQKIELVGRELVQHLYVMNKAPPPQSSYLKKITLTLVASTP